MPRSPYLTSAASAAVGAVTLALAAAQSQAGEPQLAAPRRAELVQLVRHDCGSCHGLTMKGGLGPALTPEALSDKPSEMLVATILFGRPGTPMPPWRPFLTETEAQWVVGELKKGLSRAR